ncbi:MAG: hypothetical protein SOX56_02955 [[Pasteurella] mairii]|uniref:Uncharacterized protein n=1 Tax=[Pasteurella] mairii TaxID=757 RepID=A0A379B2F3_9PAST|nr:hypothetical protein [[Pasteurella] mairii]SUB32794.1 Uncharacterised protein [[Pasteurella] mairii]
MEKTPKIQMPDEVDGFIRCKARYTRNKNKGNRRLLYAKDYGREYWVFPKKMRKSTKTTH